MSTSGFERYAKQMRFAPLGEAGQLRLSSSAALVCGCGALGATIANTLVRAGVGKVRLVDRDFLELSNLQRQVLYDEADVASGLPKAIVAQQKLAQINSQVEIEAIVADVDHTNITTLVEGMQVILDGTDNFETRFLLNDAAHAFGIPWIYGGCIGSEGQTLTILPGETACLRCLMQETPPPGATPTCDSAGILASVIQVIASLQAMEAIKILSGHVEAVSRAWQVIDIWGNTQRSIQLQYLKSSGGCPTCGDHDYPWLRGERGSHTAILCGRNAVQLTFPGSEAISLTALEAKLAGVGSITRNRFLLRLQVDSYTLTIFPEGRAIIHGTENIAEAKSIYARYVGN
jgi:adenylyltransferase/sulfurtransferase